MTDKAQVPRSIQSAYELLAGDRAADISLELQAAVEEGTTVYRFEYSEAVLTPNPEGVPARVRLRVDIPETFPFDAPKIYSMSPTVRGFPHQDAETGKLCLFDESRATLDESRLLQYVEWTRQWLDDAAHGRLLRAGDPYELPDFSRRRMQKELSSKPTVYTLESEKGFDLWKGFLGQTGTVEFATIKGFQGIFPSRFRDSSHTVIADMTLTASMIDPKGERIEGAWVLLDTLCHTRHRPPQTYGELAEQCRGATVNLEHLIGLAWHVAHSDVMPCVILFGFPIPAIVGEAPVRIHWQPLFFDGIGRQAWKHRQNRSGRIRKEGVLNRCKTDGEFADHKQVLWGCAVNISEESLYARGPLSRELRNTKVSLCGCGALGSVVAEILARGGVRELALFDQDSFELGNQCRHTLAGHEVNRSKAASLAWRLQSSNPLSTIKGYRVHLPLANSSITANSEASVALLGSEVIFDCALSDGGFQWMSKLAHAHGIRLVAMFFNLRARMLTICVSGKRAPCFEVLCRLRESIDKNMMPLTLAEYDPVPTQADKILPETGCWHATFPAVNNHIWMLAAAAMEAVIPILTGLAADGGYAVILRRQEFVSGKGIGNSLVEVLWDGIP